MFLLLEHNLSFHLFRIPFADFGRFLCFPQKSLLWSSLAYTCSLCPLPYLPYSPLSLSPLEPAKPFPIIHHLHPISVAWKFFPLIFTLWVLLIIQPSYYMSPLQTEFPYTTLYCDPPVSIQQCFLFPEKLLSLFNFSLGW